jgi:hypothetical protein
MAVLIGTRSGFELVDGADVQDVTPGHGLRPGPRVLRRFEVDGKRPAAAPPSADMAPDAVVREDRRPKAKPFFQLLGLGVLAMVAVICLGLVYLYASGSMSVPERTGVAYVQVGETLRDVAVRSAPDSDPDAVVERIRELNRMADTTVVPGQSLVVPQGVVGIAP